MDTIVNLQKDERITIGLRQLFGRHGYKKVTVNEFEEYDLYLDNKSFLKTNNIITFMDPSGKLLALKPDVTLSVVKDAIGEGGFEKIYYIDKVYRMSAEAMEFRGISQIGLELIGSIDKYSTLEVVGLALQSLGIISEHYLLDVSHMGFVAGLMDQWEWTAGQKEDILRCIHSKNVHELSELLSAAGMEADGRDRLLALCGLGGGFEETLEKARGLAVNSAMEAALGEMESLLDFLKASGFADHVALDFSVVNDLDYYNGLVFQGYVEEMPQAILTGGHYDNLTRRVGRADGAVGFAILLDALNTYFKAGEQYDVDLLLTYTDATDCGALAMEVERLIGLGYRVRTERAENLDNLRVTYRKKTAFTGDPVDMGE